MTEPVKLDYATPAKPWRHSFLTMFAISFGMAFLFVITYVVVIALSLSIRLPFQDPIVSLNIAMFASFAAALIVLPFYFICRSLPLGRSVAIIIGVTMIEVLIVTPIHAGAALVGSFVAFAAGLVAAHVFLSSAPAAHN